LLVLDQPTRGLDVGSIEFIHKQAIARRDAGVAILLVSAELDEVLELSDRIGVIYRGRIVATFDADTAERDRIGLLMARGEAGLAGATVAARGEGVVGSSGGTEPEEPR
jgi:simple sugar transport system ATP-binding protein